MDRTAFLPTKYQIINFIMRTNSPQVTDNRVLYTVVYLKRPPYRFICQQVIRVREIAHLSFTFPHPPTPCAFAALRCPPSHRAIAINLFLHPHIIPPSPRLSRPLLHRSHTTSFRRLAPNTHHNRARIGYHSRVISAQRGVAAREPCACNADSNSHTILQSGVQ